MKNIITNDKEQNIFPEGWLDQNLCEIAARICGKSITDPTEASKIVGQYNRDQNSLSR